MAESAKKFKQSTLTGERGVYYVAFSLLRSGQFSVTGGVVRRDSHYVHERTTQADLHAERNDGEGVSEADYAPFDALNLALNEQIVAWNREITKALYTELEYRQSEAAIAEELDANDVRFTPEGERTDLSAYRPFENLGADAQARALARYSKIFALPEEQVRTRLITSGELFGLNGYAVDASEFKKLAELEPRVKAKVLAKEQEYAVADSYWAEFTIEEWQEKLAVFGFKDVEIAYSLGYSQGDGASFTAKGIDVVQLCEQMLAKDKKTDTPPL